MPIQFGDFTEEECSMSTSTTTPTTIMIPKSSTISNHFVNIKSIPSLRTTSSNSSWFIFGSFTDKECMEIQNPPFRKRCIRCGYTSHTIENCVAARHKSGEYIGYPLMYPRSPSRSTSEVSNIIRLRPGDFIFNISELRDWMLHDYEYRLDAYVDTLTKSSNISCEEQFKQDTEQQNINEYLYLDYLTTNLLFEKQASIYFQNLYSKR